MSSFSDLPSELVEQILSYLAQPALYALIQTSKSLYAITTPLLYRHVDLLIPPGDRVPRIDKFFFNLLDDSGLAKQVKSVRVGLAPTDTAWDGPRFCSVRNSEPEHLIRFQKALEVLDEEPLRLMCDDLREAIWARDYGAYAALLLFILPSLRRLDISDHQNETLRPLHSIFQQVHRESNHEPEEELSPAQALSLSQSSSQPLAACIAPIQEISFNLDEDSGVKYDNDKNDVKVWETLRLPEIQKVEFAIPHERWQSIFEPRRVRPIIHAQPQTSFQQTSVTRIVIRHSSGIARCLRGILEGTPQLRSLTCELWHDAGKLISRTPSPWIDLEQWNRDLRIVQASLTTLVISVESYDSDKNFFRQPDLKGEFVGFLDLRGFHQLETLEVPIPFVSGDPHFSIARSFEPLLPPSLRHLSLRSDMTQAQFPYPFDTSILPEGLSYAEAREEANCLMGARMDLSYIASASLILVDRLYHLKSFAVWQPADPSLDWFDGQLQDFAMTCKNRSIAAKVINPLIFRRKAAANWDLVQEVTLFDPCYPECGPIKQLFRGERNGVPLGLGTQYHLGEFKKRHVRRFR